MCKIKNPIQVLKDTIKNPLNPLKGGPIDFSKSKPSTPAPASPADPTYTPPAPPPDDPNLLNPGDLGENTGEPTVPKPDAPVVKPDGEVVAPPAAPTPIPPASDRSSEVRQAGRDARRNSRKRKGLLGTLLAGETGGANNPSKTLLGQ